MLVLLSQLLDSKPEVRHTPLYPTYVPPSAPTRISPYKYALLPAGSTETVPRLVSTTQYTRVHHHTRHSPHARASHGHAALRERK